MNAASDPPFLKRCYSFEAPPFSLSPDFSLIFANFILCLSWQSSSFLLFFPAGYCHDLAAPGSPLDSCPARRDRELYWLLSVRSCAPVQFPSPGTKHGNTYKTWYSGANFTSWSVETRLDFAKPPSGTFSTGHRRPDICHILDILKLFSGDVWQVVILVIVVLSTCWLLLCYCSVGRAPKVLSFSTQVMMVLLVSDWRRKERCPYYMLHGSDGAICISNCFPFVWRQLLNRFFRYLVCSPKMLEPETSQL